MPLPIKMEPQLGWIVWCLFPYEEMPGKPCPPPPRPVLISGVHPDKKSVVVVYGSASTATLTTHEEELPSTQIELFRSDCDGLTETTRFNFLKMIPVPWTDEWFVSKRQTSIKIGNLPPTLNDAANQAKQQARDYLVANPDKAWGKPKPPKKEPTVSVRKKINRPPPSTGISDQSSE